MAIQFGGLSSGLPVNDIIDAIINAEREPIRQLQARRQAFQVEKNEFSAIQGRTNTLQSAIKKITATSFLDENLFQAKTATSANDGIVTASATENASIQTYTIETEFLATSTKAASSAAIGQLPTTGTALNAIPTKTFTSGTFAVYADGVATEITVDADNDTLGDVLTAIQNISGVASASINAEGALEITADTGVALNFGSTGDTSNFLASTRLDTPSAAGDVYTASGFLSLVDLESTDLTAAGLNTAVTAGSTFTIGEATFDTTGKSINTLIDEINATSAAGVFASFNRATNRMELTSKSTGAVAVKMEDTSGNFLSAMGLVNGADTLSSQTLGTNAKFTVNGTTYFSTSNTVDDTVSGLTGLTLELKQTNVGAPTTVTVGRNTEALNGALNDFVKAFNDVIAGVDQVTDAETGAVGPNSSLTGFRNSLRLQMLGTNDSLTTFQNLIQVGLSTGRAGTGTGEASTTLEFDASALEEALATNSTEVEELFRGTNGIFASLQAIVDAALQTGDGSNTSAGLFQAQRDSADASIDRIDDQIIRREQRLERREQTLRRQFTASENLIAQFQAQGNALSGLAAQLGANAAAAG